MSKTKREFIIPDNYPFKLDLEAQAKMLKATRETFTYERFTISRDNVYLAGKEAMFVKLFQNVRILNELSPSACKILVHICCTLEYGDTMVTLRYQDVDMAKNTFYKAALELTHVNVLRKVPGKKEMYWINVSLISNGDAHNKALIRPPE